MTNENYDDSNVFAKILRGEIPAKKIFENEQILAFADINPIADVHVLVIPKGEFVSFDHFLEKASSVEVAVFFENVKFVAEKIGVKGAYRMVTNVGEKAGQTVRHFHVHILAGEEMPEMA